LIDRADPRQVSIFGAEHTKEILKNMSRPIKELRDLVAEKRTELEELQAELLAAEIAENEAANEDDWEPLTSTSEIGWGYVGAEICREI
jgi:Sec-independent protein translocase protein TatA